MHICSVFLKKKVRPGRCCSLRMFSLFLVEMQKFMHVTTLFPAWINSDARFEIRQYVLVFLLNVTVMFEQVLGQERLFRRWKNRFRQTFEPCNPSFSTSSSCVRSGLPPTLNPFLVVSPLVLPCFYIPACGVMRIRNVSNIRSRTGFLIEAHRIRNKMHPGRAAHSLQCVH